LSIVERLRGEQSVELAEWVEGSPVDQSGRNVFLTRKHGI
jgi:hypothetical protein